MIEGGMVFRLNRDLVVLLKTVIQPANASANYNLLNQ